MWPVAKSGEPKAKRMRPDVTFGEEENPAEPGPERPAAKQQERGNSSTFVETTCHLSVRALDLYLDGVGFGNDAGRMFLAVGPNRLPRAPLHHGHFALGGR